MKGTLIYIAGSRRSGSTLLELMLGNSHNVATLGEVHRLKKFAEMNEEPCTCGQAVTSCKFWLEAGKHFRESDTYSGSSKGLFDTNLVISSEDCSVVSDAIERFVILVGSRALFRIWYLLVAPKAHKRAIEDSFRLYGAVLRAQNVAYVVDSSKDARRMALLYHYSAMTGQNMKVIHMVRDGRGTILSSITEAREPIETAARKWASRISNTLRAIKGIPCSDKMELRYETLCKAPEEELERVCQHTGLQYDQGMTVLRKAEAHNIGGNPMRFRQTETRVVFDERWKKVMSQEELDRFDRVAGRVLRQLGY